MQAPPNLFLACDRELPTVTGISVLWLNHYAKSMEVVKFIGYIQNASAQLETHKADALATFRATHNVEELYRYHPDIEAALHEEFDFRTYSTLLAEMAFCRAVDIFLNYLAKALEAIIRLTPEKAMAKEQVLLEEVFKFPDMDSFIKNRAEKKIGELSQNGYKAIVQHFEKYGVALLTDKDLKQDVDTAIALRNIVVHNGAVMNSINKKNCPTFPLEVGEHIACSMDTFFDGSRSLDRACYQIDSNLIAGGFLKNVFDKNPKNAKPPETPPQESK